MIKLWLYDIKHDKDFTVETDYEDTIKRLKKYSYSSNIYCIDYVIKSNLNYDKCRQISYWYSRQFNIKHYEQVIRPKQ